MKFKNGYLVDIREAGYGWAEEIVEDVMRSALPESRSPGAVRRTLMEAVSKGRGPGNIDEHKSRILTITFEE